MICWKYFGFGRGSKKIVYIDDVFQDFEIADWMYHLNISLKDEFLLIHAQDMGLKITGVNYFNKEK